MLLLHAFFLWLMASTLIIGGAVVFHRRYPEESPWFGFILPPLALVILLNFIEHGIALPVLFIFLPVLLAGTVWLIAVKKWFAQPLVLPTVVFLISFAFTFGIRCLRPDILSSSDGISDLNMVNNYSQGQTLPPPDTWMPPFRFEWYYGLQHYAASVLERLLNVKIGEAYNVSHALLSALICVTAAGAAWRISGGRTWITLAVPFIIESAMTGSSAYLLLTSTNPSVDLFPDPSGGMIHPPDKNPLWAWLFSDLPATLQNDPAKIPDFQTLRLQVPGFWTWRDEYHANASGHFFTILSVLAVAELVEPRKTIWPWVVAILTPLLAVVASAWALPITTLLCWPAILIALLCGRRPAATGTALLTLFVALTLLWPAFNNATSSPELPHVEWIKPLEHVPLYEFLVQWWPILLLWIGGCVAIRDLSFGLRWFLIVIPAMLIGIEQFDIESRYNVIEKMWGDTWAVGLAGLFPLVAARAGAYFRIVTILLLFSALVTLGGYLRDVSNAPLSNAFHLEGYHGYISNDAQKEKMFEALRPFKHATFLSGKSAFCYNEAPALATFTGNKSYIAWFWFESLTDYKDESDARKKLNDDFYSDSSTMDRLRFLQSNKITGVLIWPDDDISDDLLNKLSAQLDPAYDYVDCKGDGQKNAGVFLLRPRD